MKRLFGSGWFLLVVFGALVLLASSMTFPGRRVVALDSYVLFLGALGLAGGTRATRAATPEVHAPILDDTLDDPLDPLPQRPTELARLEREVYLSLGSSFYLHHRLRPLLREAAAHRLLLRHGVDAEARPDAAEAILGDTAWAWLRADRPEPRDRWAPGPPIGELRALVDAIERI
jgi:hypothetical protein